LPRIAIPLITKALSFESRQAVTAPEGTFTYKRLLESSARAAARILDGRSDLAEARVAFLIPPGLDYTAVMWGVWRAGGVAVPMALSHPRPELEYVIEDARASILVAHPDLIARLAPVAGEKGLPLIGTGEALAAEPGALPEVDASRRAMMVYTSGTTSRPKGVVTTHEQIAAQISSLVQAWGWTPDDHILNVLPMHHLHGILNILSCALWSGALCEFMPEFEAGAVWRRMARGGLTLFMAVPTIYVRLIAAWEAMPEAERRRMSEAAARLRLMVSGSAALPVSVLEKWREITGHVLLERYGMTEIGMALSNPLDGRRAPGTVGRPLPGVRVRLVDEGGDPAGEGSPGQIQVKGPNVFLEYWRRPEATAESFTPDGWFRTGDVGRVEDGYYRILGRESVDILKTGGYKVSALEIEEVLRDHPSIAECAVVGVPDPEWGQRVGAALILKPGSSLALEDLRAWGKERLAPYKVPSLLSLPDHLPRNAMGKVTKPDVVRLFEQPPDRRSGS